MSLICWQWRGGFGVLFVLVAWQPTAAALTETDLCPRRGSSRHRLFTSTISAGVTVLEPASIFPRGINGQSSARNFQVSFFDAGVARPLP